jgi:hypothetical protein
MTSKNAPAVHFHAALIICDFTKPAPQQPLTGQIEQNTGG